MPWCPKCKTEYREGDICLKCNVLIVEQEPQVAWRWYAQVGSVMVLAIVATIVAYYASIFVAINSTPFSIWGVIITLFAVLTIIAIIAGYFAGRQWSPLWIFVGWLIPFAVFYAIFKQLGYGGGGDECERTFALTYGFFPVLGTASTMIGILMSTFRRWIYALLAIPFLSIAIAAFWQFLKAID